MGWLANTADTPDTPLFGKMAPYMLTYFFNKPIVVISVLLSLRIGGWDRYAAAGWCPLFFCIGNELLSQQETLNSDPSVNLFKLLIP
uniref:Uncharacterized protein n=1 Tax=Moorena producens (strain JHB) TaxID=1454205 RepID=A0A1D9G0I1_MOOP1